MHGNAEHVLVVLFSKCGTDYTYTSIHFRPKKTHYTCRPIRCWLLFVFCIHVVSSCLLTYVNVLN